MVVFSICVHTLHTQNQVWETAPKPGLGDSTKTSFGRQHQNQFWETAPKPGLGDGTKTSFGRLRVIAIVYCLGLRYCLLLLPTVNLLIAISYGYCLFLLPMAIAYFSPYKHTTLLKAHATMQEKLW